LTLFRNLKMDHFFPSVITERTMMVMLFNHRLPKAIWMKNIVFLLKAMSRARINSISRKVFNRLRKKAFSKKSRKCMRCVKK
jgi:hypothetical protein